MFNYAHKDTSGGERQTPTAKLNIPAVDEDLKALRKSAFEREIPTSGDETLCVLLTLAKAINPQKILELGTATGISGIAMLKACPNARLTTVEKSEEFYSEAIKNFKDAEVLDRVTAIWGDAGEEILKLENDSFDLIFLDCAKVQYIKYLPALKGLLRDGGTLIADDILLFGYITGEAEVPKKRKMLVEHIKEYISAVKADKDFTTSILNAGDGLCISVISKK